MANIFGRGRAFGGAVIQRSKKAGEEVRVATSKIQLTIRDRKILRDSDGSPILIPKSVAEQESLNRLNRFGLVHQVDSFPARFQITPRGSRVLEEMRETTKLRGVSTVLTSIEAKALAQMRLTDGLAPKEVKTNQDKKVIQKLLNRKLISLAPVKNAKYKLTSAGRLVLGEQKVSAAVKASSIKEPWRMIKAEYKGRLSHKTIVENALKAGKPVPLDVLEDYPGLSSRYALKVQQGKVKEKGLKSRSPFGR